MAARCYAGDTPLEVWFADHYEDLAAAWLAGNSAMVKRVTCATRAGRRSCEPWSSTARTAIALLRNLARVAERLTGVIKAAVEGNNKGVRCSVAEMVEGGWVETAGAGARGRTPLEMGTGNWTMPVRERWQERAQESDTRTLLEKVMRGATRWTREPLQSWMSRRGGGWRLRFRERG